MTDLGLDFDYGPFEHVDPGSADVSSRVVAGLQRDGIVVLDRSLVGDDLARIVSEVAVYRERHPDPGNPAGRAKFLNTISCAHKGTLRETPRMSEFAAQPLFREIAKEFFRPLRRRVYVMGILSIETPANLNGITKWHVDASSPSYDVETQYNLKFHTYLNDVRRRNGAFSYYRGSHILLKDLREGMMGERLPVKKLHVAENFIEYFEQNRAALARDGLDERLAAVCDFMKRTPTAEGDSCAVEAPAGSVVIFDERGIHRGGFVQPDEHRSVLRVSFRPEVWSEHGMLKNLAARRFYGLTLPAPYRHLM